MTDRPRISVLIITYRRLDEVQGVLENVLALQPAPDEIILYDDDPAGSAQSVIPVDDPRIHYVCRQHNFGPAGARNRAAEMATGDILLFIDDDCRFASTAVCQMVLDLFADTSIAFLAFLIRNAFTGAITPHEYPGYQVHGWERPHEVSYFVASGFAIRRTVFEEVGGFDEALYHGEEELDLSLRILDAGWRMWYTPELLVHHRVSPLGRDTIHRIYQLTRNRLYLAGKHLPWPYLLSHLLIWGGFIFLKAVRQRQLPELWRGLRSVRADKLWSRALSYRQAHPMKRETLAYLQRNEGRLWY